MHQDDRARRLRLRVVRIVRPDQLDLDLIQIGVRHVERHVQLRDRFEVRIRDIHGRREVGHCRDVRTGGRVESISDTTYASLEDSGGTAVLDVVVADEIEGRGQRAAAVKVVVNNIDLAGRNPAIGRSA